jgi:glycosyltransferase involved in cell wall biosynthesis
MSRVSYLNPLTKTLVHYARELEQTLQRCGLPSRELTSGSAEGLGGVSGKARMAYRGVRNARRLARSDADLAIGLWPTFGLLEIPLVSGGHRRTAVIIHDPRPITHQVGYGPRAQRLAAWTTRRGGPTLLVHSDEAEADVRSMLPAATVVNVPHPILTTQRASHGDVPRRVVVAGQYKPERDIDLLNDLGPRLRANDIEAVVAGRGWSNRLNPSWEVHDRFVTETELDSLLASAAAVVIPYRRYYQSGIAIRALELGTTPIGEENSFLGSLLGSSSMQLREGADAEDYLSAILSATSGRAETAGLFRDFQSRVDRGWSGLLTHMPTPT